MSVCYVCMSCMCVCYVCICVMSVMYVMPVCIYDVCM